MFVSLPVPSTLYSPFIAASQTDVYVCDCFSERLEGRVIPEVIPHRPQPYAATSVGISSLLGWGEVIDFREKHQCKRTLIGCLPCAPSPAIKPTT